MTAAIAAERLNQDALDRLARALWDRPELDGLEWDWLMTRAEEIRAEGPLFSDVRTTVIEVLERSELAGLALDFARSIVDEPSDDAEVILTDVAHRLDLELPADREPLPGLYRGRFNDPEDTTDIPFHEALARADGPERRLLLFKLRAARFALAHLGRGARVLELGRHIPRSRFLFRADALIEAATGRYTCRFIASAEAMHPAEHRILLEWSDELRFGEHILIAHDGRVAPPDGALLETLPSDVTHRLDLSILS